MYTTINDHQAQAYNGGGKVSEVYAAVTGSLLEIASGLSNSVPLEKLGEIAPKVGLVLSETPNF